MKICFVGSARSIHVQRWVKWFVERGHEVHLITPVYEEIEGAEIYKIGGKEGSITNFVRKMFQTRKLVKKIKPDILHAHYVFGYGTFAAFASYHPFVVTAWGSDILVDPSSRIKKIAVKHALKKADVITCDALHLKESMTKLGADGRKISIVYFGTDTTKYSPHQRDKSIRKELRLIANPVVISLRSLNPIYDVETLIDAIPLVLKDVPKAKFVIAGRGTQEEMLKSKANMLGISSSVRFVGFISNDKLPHYLTSSDVYVSTSLSDAGLSASTAEAMACGIPVVVTDFGANSEWVTDGKNGFVIPMKDPNLLAEKIIILLKDKDLREKFGQNGRLVIKEKLDFNKEMNKMGKIYKRMINKEGR